MTIEITFVRHAETDANAASIWQGQGDAELSARGRSQARALGGRIDPARFNRIISSDLHRTLETSTLAGVDPVPDASWREMDIGVWEGLNRHQVEERFPAEMARLRSGDRDVAMGGGETWSEFTARVGAAVDRLVSETDPGSRVLIVSHGGVIHAALSRGLGLDGRRPWPISRIRNSAVTKVAASEHGFRLESFNDARHADEVLDGYDESGVPIALIRHGESESNVAGRWDGRTDGPLTKRGVDQARDLARRHNGISRVYSSPLQRTLDTAHTYASAHGLEVDVFSDLAEIDFGDWEGLTPAEIEASFPDDFRRVFHADEDIPRGGSGETYAGVGERMESAVRTLADRHPEDRLALFSHGGAIWMLASRVLGLSFSDRDRLAMPRNASITHVRFEDGSPVLADYNLEP